MGQRILINHLTRMRGPHVCVAGLGTELRHVRPVRTAGRWTRSALRIGNGAFEIGAVVRFDGLSPHGRSPEVEDHLVDAGFRWERRLDPSEFASVLAQASQADLRSIFGGELRRVGAGRAFVPPGHGVASLGVLTSRPIEMDAQADAIRVRFDDGLGPMDLSLTDVRFYDADGSVRSHVVGVTQALLARGSQPFLAVGLGQPFPPNDPQHWLQVNNLHFPEYLDDLLAPGAP